jgi:excisionase family DNA binding protein
MPSRAQQSQDSPVSPDDDSLFLYSMPEVMAVLKVGRNTVLRLLEARALEGMKVGGQWKFSRQAVRDFLSRSAHVPKRKRKDGDGVTPE